MDNQTKRLRLSSPRSVIRLSCTLFCLGYYMVACVATVNVCINELNAKVSFCIELKASDDLCQKSLTPSVLKNLIAEAFFSRIVSKTA